MREGGFKLLSRSLGLGFCTSSTDKIVAAVLFERLPVVIPKIDPVIYAFQEYSFRWRQQYRRRYPDEVLTKSDASTSINSPSNALPQISCSKHFIIKGKGDYHIDYVPAPRVTEADKTNDRRGHWTDDFIFSSMVLLMGLLEENLSGIFLKRFMNLKRPCVSAESALKSVIGDLSQTYFVGNAPFAHMVIQPTEDVPYLPSFKRFFFKSQVIATNKFKVGKCEDHVWVTKDELMEFFPEQAAFLNQMIIS